MARILSDGNASQVGFTCTIRKLRRAQVTAPARGMHTPNARGSGFSPFPRPPPRPHRECPWLQPGHPRAEPPAQPRAARRVEDDGAGRIAYPERLGCSGHVIIGPGRSTYTPRARILMPTGSCYPVGSLAMRSRVSCRPSIRSDRPMQRVVPRESLFGGLPPRHVSRAGAERERGGCACTARRSVCCSVCLQAV
jgi:hypothetical protein